MDQAISPKLDLNPVGQPLGVEIKWPGPILKQQTESVYS